MPEKGNYEKGLKTVNACIEIIQKCGITGGLKFWALENPKGYLRRFLGKPYLEFDPFDYGDPWSKRTDLWGFFHKPRQNVVKRAGDKFSKNTPPLDIPNGYKKPPDMRDIRACKRSITPPGFAQAFYRANK